MTPEKKEKIEDLKYRLKDLQTKEDALMIEVEEVRGQKKRILDELSSLSDAKYEQDMLELVYQQRRKKTSIVLSRHFRLL